jgi:hypothetical protein
MFLAPDYPLSGAIVHLAGGRAGTWQTIRTMRALVNAGKVQPELIHAAVSAIYLTPETDELAEVSAVFAAVRDGVRYVRDVCGVETLCDPLTTLRRRAGDCDDQSTLLAAMLEAVGYPTRFIVAGYSGPDFEHVYVQVYARGQWIDLDPTEHNGVGWAPPYPTIYQIEGA